jgi:hypothetical protein
MLPLLVPVGLGLIGGYLLKDDASFSDGGGIDNDKEVSEDRYYEMLGVVPPIYFKTLDGINVKGGFAVGEVYSHEEIDGKFRGVYSGFYIKADKFYEVNGMVYFTDKNSAKRAKIKEFADGGNIINKQLSDEGFAEYALGGEVLKKEYEPVEGTPFELKAQIYYSKGGMNYYSGKNEQRGYWLSVSPVKVDRQPNGIMTETYTAFSGVKVLLLETQRKSAKYENEAIKLAEEKLPQLKSQVISKIKAS